MTTSLRIVTVCTGNICRSPMAQYWMRAALPEDEVLIESAGTSAMVGRGMDQRSAALTVRFGGDPRSHVARQLDERILSGADLVLAMAREHREAVVSMVPALARRAFTIIEIERLIAAERFSSLRRLAAQTDGPPSARMPVLLDALAARRSDVRLAGEASIDVVDPYRRDDEVGQRSAAQLLPAVETVVELVRTALGPQGRPAADPEMATVSPRRDAGARW